MSSDSSQIMDRYSFQEYSRVAVLAKIIIIEYFLLVEITGWYKIGVKNVAICSFNFI